jgi:ankyrin repeat protein
MRHLQLRKKKSTYLPELDDDLKAMTQEFNEDIRDKLKKNIQYITCKRCKAKISRLDYHYSCPESATKVVICQKCFHGIEKCLVHRKKLLKYQFKPWHVSRGMFCVDTSITTEDNELIQALKLNNTTKTRQYAQNRALLDSQDRLGLTPLHVAAHLGLEEGTALLIECGAVLETRDYKGFSPLHTAIDANQIKIVQILLDGGANIEMVHTIDDAKALHIAARFAMHHIVTLLVRRGAKIDSLSDTGTPLFWAITAPNNHKCVEVLLAAGANVNYIDNTHLVTPLDLANDDGYTPLMLVAKMGHLDACKSLLEKNPQLDIQSSKTSGKNAIYFAARGGHEEILDLLIAAGASCLPTKAVSGIFTLGSPKWKSLDFLPDVTPESKKRILRKLSAAKHN